MEKDQKEREEESKVEETKQNAAEKGKASSLNSKLKSVIKMKLANEMN